MFNIAAQQQAALAQQQGHGPISGCHGPAAGCLWWCSNGYGCPRGCIRQTWQLD